MIYKIEVSNKGNNFIVYRCFVDSESNKTRIISFVLSRRIYNIFKLYDTKFLLNKMCSYVISIPKSECNKGLTHDFGIFTLKVFNSHSCCIKKTIQEDPLANLIVERELLKHRRNISYQIITSNILWFRSNPSIFLIGEYECTGLHKKIDESIVKLITMFNQLASSLPWNSICDLLSNYYIFGKAYRSALYFVNHGEPSDIPSQVILPQDDLIISILKQKLKRLEYGQYYLSKHIKNWVYE